MNGIITALRIRAQTTPDRTALCDTRSDLSYADLIDRVDGLAADLHAHRCRTVGLMADNGIDWVVADLAALASETTIVPLPPYFSESQLRHVIEASSMDTVILDEASSAQFPRAAAFEQKRQDGRLRLLQQPANDSRIAAGSGAVAKITFTSGSTGQPKGVCLSAVTIDQVTFGLCNAFANIDIARHLCVMPLATLLENVAGVYVPLLLGTTVFVPSLASLGLYGSSRVDARRFRRTIDRVAAESLILQPQLLRELTAVSGTTGRDNSRLKFVAVGGARVAESDLQDAAAAGIPAFQGYGLSECASVVTLNRPGASRPGSVGQPLEGVVIRISEGGEIVVENQCMLGYLGETGDGKEVIATGDIGHFDDDGFLYVTGRRKNVFITSFGRNVSPEWPEAELLHQSEIAQVCVFGEAQPFNTAVICPADSGISADRIADAIFATNRNLPDYARVSDFVIADEPFSVANGLLTSTGKARREAIALRYIIPNERWFAPDGRGSSHRHHSINEKRTNHETL